MKKTGDGKRQKHSPEFKLKVVLEASKGAAAVSESATGLVCTPA